MKQAGAVLLLFLLLGLALSVALSRVGVQAVDVWAEQANRPMSATEAVLHSRQTPDAGSQPNGRSGWWGAGLLALGVMAVGGILLLLRSGTTFLRQWRLLRKRPSRRRQAPTFVPDYLPLYPEPSQVRPVPRVPYLPEVSDDVEPSLDS